MRYRYTQQQWWQRDIDSLRGADDQCPNSCIHTLILVLQYDRPSRALALMWDARNLVRHVHFVSLDTNMRFCFGCARHPSHERLMRIEELHRMHLVFDKCYCADVYDGDTFTLAVHMFDTRWVRVRCRLRGVDTPEMRQPTKMAREQREVNKRAALAARDFVRKLLLHKWHHRVSSHGFDKYGRMLVDVFVNDGSLAAVLVSHGHGVPYNGGTKCHKVDLLPQKQ